MAHALAFGVLVLGLASSLPEGTSASASPAEVPGDACLGLLRSALVRSGAVLQARDDETGELVVLDRSFRPGHFRGTTGLAELFRLFPFLEQNGCALPIPDLTSCIDFSADDRCGDMDDDGYWNELERQARSDPENASSTPESALLDEQAGSNTCSDRLDNDLDGRRGSADPGCRVTCEDFGDQDRCSDDDRDGWLKYVEIRYGSDPDNPNSTPVGVSDCIDFDQSTVCEP